MIFASASQFYFCSSWVNAHLALCLNIHRFLNVKALIVAFNLEKAIVGTENSRAFFLPGRNWRRVNFHQTWGISHMSAES